MTDLEINIPFLFWDLSLSNLAQQRLKVSQRSVLFHYTWAVGDEQRGLHLNNTSPGGEGKLMLSLRKWSSKVPQRYNVNKV